MLKPHWIWNSEQQIPSDPVAGRKAVDRLLAELERQEWIEHDIFGVHLAVEEALINAIRHGNRENLSKSIQLRCKLSPELLRIEIADQGNGFDPNSVPDPTQEENLETPSGRGLMLMRTFMSHVEFNDSGTCVIMEKRRCDCL